jgi:hypothetical protein
MRQVRGLALVASIVFLLESRLSKYADFDRHQATKRLHRPISSVAKSYCRTRARYRMILAAISVEMMVASPKAILELFVGGDLIRPPPPSFR